MEFCGGWPLPVTVAPSVNPGRVKKPGSFTAVQNTTPLLYDSYGACSSRPPSVSGSDKEFVPLSGREDRMKDIQRRFSIAVVTASSIGLLFQIAIGTSPAQTNDAALIAKAKGIHERVLKLDTHNDIEPANFTPDCNYTMRLTTQVNIPKMVEGGMDVSFMIAYVGQGPLTPEGFDDAYRQAVAKFDAVHRLTEQIAPDNILALRYRPPTMLALHKEASADRRHRCGERVSHRDRHQESGRVLQQRRALHVFGAQWQ